MSEAKQTLKSRRASSIKACENIKKVSSKKKRQDEYEVEDILSHTVVDGVTFYKVSWVGYPNEFSELKEEDLANCEELLKSYKEKMERIVDMKDISSVTASVNQSENNQESAKPGENGKGVQELNDKDNTTDVKKKGRKYVPTDNEKKSNDSVAVPKRARRSERSIAPDSELGYTNGCIVDSLKGFSAKYNEPIVLVSYKEPLPSGFEDKQDEIVPIRLVAEKDPQKLITHLVTLLAHGRANVAL